VAFGTFVATVNRLSGILAVVGWRDETDYAMLARSTDTTAATSAPKAPDGGPAAERSAIFRSAARHSRNVRVLKVALPALAVVMAALFIFQSYRLTPSAIEIKADASAVSEGKLVMSNPTLEGFTKDNQPYSMSAIRAVQDIANEAILELEGIAATVPLNANTSATIDAPRGVFDRITNTLDLNSEINIETSDGAVAKLNSAHIDIGAGSMTTDKPV
jgi:lipopolysaccharide export system protein LptC